MCNLYRFNPKDWPNRWAQDAENLVGFLYSSRVLSSLAKGRQHELHKLLLLQGNYEVSIR